MLPVPVEPKLTGSDATALPWASRATTVRKLVPPATDAPGPSGPGNGMVVHESASDGGNRFLNSAMFQGPLM